MESPPDPPVEPIDVTLPEAGAPQPAPQAAPAPAPAPPAAIAPAEPRAPIAAWKLGVLAGIGAALAGGGVALAIGLTPLRSNPLPYPAEELPARFGTISWYAPVVSYVDLARSYSIFATHCGGPDVFGLATSVDQFYATEELATTIRDVERTEAYLRCGKNLAQRSGGMAYALSLTNAADPPKPSDARAVPPPSPYLAVEQSPDQLLLVALDANEIVLDGRFVKRAHGGFGSLWCGAAEGSPCGDGLGAGRLAGAPYWMFGTGAALERYGDGVDAKAYLDDKGAAAVARLARDVEGYRSTTIGGPKGRFQFSAFNLLPYWGKEVNDARLAFESKLTELGAYWASGTPNDVEGEARLEIVAESGRDAREILSVLRDYRSALKHVDLDELPATGSIAYQRWRAAIGSMAKRALVDSEPEREDEVITYVVRLKADTDEGQAIYRWTLEYEKRERAYADLVHALISGRDPDERTLRAIGGRELWLSVDQGLKNRHGRLGAPAAEAVPDLADVPVPGGGEIDTRTLATQDSTRYRFRVPKDEAIAIVNELKELLAEAGWTVALDSFELGPIYRCERDSRRLAVQVNYVVDELVIAYKPLP